MQASDRVTYQVLSTVCDFTGHFSTPQMDGFTTALPGVIDHASFGGSSTWAHPVSLQTLAPSEKACQGMALPQGLLKTRPTGYLNCLLESCHVVLPDLLSLFHLWGGGNQKSPRNILLIKTGFLVLNLVPFGSLCRWSGLTSGTENFRRCLWLFSGYRAANDGKSPSAFWCTVHCAMHVLLLLKCS